MSELETGSETAEEPKVRLGGMALANGVLVHGPSAWACAVRTPDGSVRIAAEPKKVIGAGVQSPFVRGPVRFVESLAFLPRLKRVLPEAELPFMRPAVLASMLAGAVISSRIEDTDHSELAKELFTGVTGFVPALIALRSGELAAYHGAEHIAIGSYEHGEPRAREHERCGTHLAGPLIVTSLVGRLLASRAPERYRRPARLAAGVVALAVATETFGWMQRHPDQPLARALAWPGHEFQHRIGTAEPTPAQLEVAEAALAACLELEAAA